MESLQNILSEMKLYSQVKEYVCFTEAPITSFIYNLEHMSNYSIPMFSSYGFGFNRDFLFRKYNALKNCCCREEERWPDGVSST